MDDEMQAEENRKENEKCLKIFENDLKAKGLSEKTIEMHMFNVEFYINTFLNDINLLPMDEGYGEIGEFFGYWYIRKAMWSTCQSMKDSSAGIKKFYKCMMENNKIDSCDYKMLCDTIKICMPEWLLAMEEYNDFDSDDDMFAWLIR